MATREYPQFIVNPMGFLLINNCELSKETIDDKYILPIRLSYKNYTIHFRVNKHKKKFDNFKFQEARASILFKLTHVR